MQRDQISAYLFDQLHLVAPFPTKLRHVPKMVNGTAFFPGGAGLWKETSTATFPDIMVIAHDFSTAAEHANMLNDKCPSPDLKSTTWKKFQPIASKVGLDLERCFFTNAIMGLRAEGPSQGKNPGYNIENTEFMQRTHEFVKLQVSVLKPRLILVLGLQAAKVLASCSPDLKGWSVRKANEIEACKQTEIDSNGLALVKNATIGHVKVPLAQLVHPANWDANVQRRRYAGKERSEAEYSLIRDALALIEAHG